MESQLGVTNEDGGLRSGVYMTTAPLTRAGEHHTAVVEDDFSIKTSSICVSLLLGLLSLTGALGNSLVIAAVFRYPQLIRTTSNFFIVSLACADFLISALVMPPAVYYKFFLLAEGKQWHAGAVCCGIWTCLDVLLRTASILGLCAVSVDRYRSITKPLEYALNRKPWRACRSVAAVWTTAAFVSAASIPSLTTEDGSCHLGGSPASTLVSSAVSFFVPCTVIVVVYARIYKVAKRTARSNCVAPALMSVVLRKHTLQDATVSSLLGGTSGNTTTAEDRGGIKVHFNTSNVLNVRDAYHRQSGSNIRFQRHCNFASQRSRLSVLRERKATRMVFIAVCVFVVCWAPFFSTSVLSTLSPSIAESRKVPTVLEWFGWTNSVINPITYTIFNKDFRFAFKKIVHLRK